MAEHLRALLVEDSEDDALLIAFALERGFERVTAQRVDTPEDFSLALERDTWDVVISDHRMPRFSSTAALKLLQASALDIPFIIVSGSIGEEIAVAAMRTGASDYLLKGNLARLVPAVERELRDVGRRRASRLAEQTLRSLEIENARALEAGRVKMQLLANVSHELRTPLNAIIGFSELLIDGKGGVLNDTQRRRADLIHDSGQHLLRLINDLLDLAKIDAGRLNVICEPCDVLPIVRDAVQMLEPLSSARQISLQLVHADAVPIVSADPERVKQILYNLLSNAIKFTAPSGHVSVRAELMPEAALVRISVTDTGVGIPAADLQRLFAPFTQLENARRTSGTGLGLALVKQLTELMGGRVGVESTAGVGSTFTVDLPTAGGVAESTPAG